MFSDGNLQLGENFQNWFLYVKGTIEDVSLSRILLDYGSTVNLLPYKTFKVMGMKSKQLSPSNLILQSFNQVGQRAIGSISLKVEIEELYSEALLDVLDVDTSYNVLLGCPWVHTYGIIGSALHQCFKLCDEDGNVKMVYTDPNPFMGDVRHQGSQTQLGLGFRPNSTAPFFKSLLYSTLINYKSKSRPLTSAWRKFPEQLRKTKIQTYHRVLGSFQETSLPGIFT